MLQLELDLDWSPDDLHLDLKSQITPTEMYYIMKVIGQPIPFKINLNEQNISGTDLFHHKIVVTNTILLQNKIICTTVGKTNT